MTPYKRITANRLARVILRYMRSGRLSLHIVLEDGNTDRSSLRWAAEWAAEERDWSGARLARLMLTATPTQWTAAIKRASRQQKAAT